MNRYRITDNFTITLDGFEEDLLAQGKFKYVIRKLKKIVEENKPKIEVKGEGQILTR